MSVGSPDHEPPQISIVAVSRNDTHGGDMQGRMQHFVNGFVAQCRKHQLRAELVLVEWNPPGDRPPLEDALIWPEDFGPATVRIVTVPPDVHAEFPHSAALPLFQMIGKNVGIRRALGRYVLATNIDILLDDETVVYLRDHLTPGTVVRADRFDVPGDLTKKVPFDQVLAECRTRCFQVNTRFGIFDFQTRRILGMGNGFEGRLLSLYTEARFFGLLSAANRNAARLCAVSFKALKSFAHSLIGGLAGWKSSPMWIAKALAGSAHVLFHAVLNAPAFCRRECPKLWPLSTMPSRGYWYFRRMLRRAEAYAQTLPRPVRVVLFAPRWFLRKLQSLSKAWRLMTPVMLRRSRSAAESRLARSQRLHTWACGDFTLLAREDWFRLRGYPEWPVYSWHIDSALMFAANAHDIREIALGPRYRVYHIDHSVGSGWSPTGEDKLFGRLKSRGIPYLSNDDLRDWQRRAAEDPTSIIVNPADWGLAGHNLPERRIEPGGRDTHKTAPRTAAVVNA
jgi:hypothetical protein